MKIIMRLFATLFAVMLCGLFAAAQTTSGTITGRVTDTSGAVIPEASVQLVEQQTKVSQAAKTSADGSFVFPVVQPGTYSIKPGIYGQCFHVWENCVYNTVLLSCAIIKSLIEYIL